MEVEDPNQKTKKIHHRINPTDLNQRHKKRKSSPKSKNKKNWSYPKPNGLKSKAIKRKKKPSIKKQKKIHHILNPTDLTQRQYIGKRRPKSKNKKNPS